MKQWRQVRLQSVPDTWNQRSSRWASGTDGAGPSSSGSGTDIRAPRYLVLLPVQIKVRLAREQRERLTHLLEAGPQQEVRVAAVALGAEDEEVRLRVAQRRAALRGHRQAVGAGVLQQH